MTEEEIENIILRELGMEARPDGAPLVYGETFGWDSSSHMNIILAFEDVLGVQFEADDIVRMTSVPGIAEVIRALPNG